jgi:putative ATPase
VQPTGWVGTISVVQHDLFDLPGLGRSAPLAARMRPRTLAEVVGQKHLTGPGMPLARLVNPDLPTVSSDRRALDQQAITSVILWGGPGTGKTTLASLAATVSGREFAELSAVNAGVADVRKVIEKARATKRLHGKDTILFVDEVHRFSKSQQDALLPAVENGWGILVAATTENPSFSVISPLLSRSLLLTLNPLTDDDLRELISRAISEERGLGDVVTIDAEAVDMILRYADGDARRALTALEAAAAAALTTSRQTASTGAGTAIEGNVVVPSTDTADTADTAGSAVPVIDTALVRGAVARAVARYDRDGDQHYDVISAFIKSIRGSDVDAALHYLARMIVAGEDPRFIARRLIVHASEDIGLADPTALHTAVAAAHTVALVGMPEARIALAQATIHLSLASKSNAVITAIDSAIADVEAGRTGQVPVHLRDAHYAGAARLGHGVAYKYPHDYPAAVVAQQYLPDTLKKRAYFKPTGNGREAGWAERYQRVRAFLRGETRTETTTPPSSPAGNPPSAETPTTS